MQYKQQHKNLTKTPQNKTEKNKKKQKQNNNNKKTSHTFQHRASNF